MNKHNQNGFTIVELLIVIVVIAILAAITIVAYNGIQVRGRDAQRQQDISTIKKYVEMYIADNGSPPTTTGGCWATRSNITSNTCENPNNFQSLSQYFSSPYPRDPINTTTNFYLYYRGYAKNGSTYAASTSNRYVIVTRLEGSSDPLQTLPGEPTNFQFNYGVGN